MNNLKLGKNLSFLLGVVLTATLLFGCADENKRLNYLKKTYPNSKVEPATGLIQRDGYEFILIDSNLQIIAVSFYPFSESKIQSMRNIR